VNRVLLITLTAAVMLVGLLGSLIPLVPDVVLIWGAALAFGFIGGWSATGGWLFALITLLGVAGLLTEVWVSSAGARAGGASFGAILAGLGLGLVGLLIFPPLGGFAGLIFGVFLVEYLRLKDSSKSLRALLGTSVGFGVSFIVKLFLCLAMIGIWIVWTVVG
jgi:uncharacterized protein YqgC (DUF456 family)